MFRSGISKDAVERRSCALTLSLGDPECVIWRDIACGATVVAARDAAYPQVTASKLGQHLGGDEARDAASHHDAVQQAVIGPPSSRSRGRIDARPSGNCCRHREGHDTAGAGVALLMQCMLPELRAGVVLPSECAATRR